MMLYDSSGLPVAYSDDGRNIYGFDGTALAYFDGDSVYSFNGAHLGWWSRGWVRDHQGACVLFTSEASGGPLTPARRAEPAKGFKNAPPPARLKDVKPPRGPDSSNWSSSSGRNFFAQSR